MNTKEDIKKAVEVMRKGGVILYPTDTVWGIGCDATNAEAVKRVYEIKRRDDSKALICLVDSDARLQRYVRNVPNVAWDLLNLNTKPTTVILDNAVNLAPNLVAQDGTIAMRQFAASRAGEEESFRCSSSWRENIRLRWKCLVSTEEESAGRLRP